MSMASIPPCKRGQVNMATTAVLAMLAVVVQANTVQVNAVCM